MAIEKLLSLQIRNLRCDERWSSSGDHTSACQRVLQSPRPKVYEP